MQALNRIELLALTCAVAVAVAVTGCGASEGFGSDTAIATGTSAATPTSTSTSTGEAATSLGPASTTDTESGTSTGEMLSPVPVDRAHIESLVGSWGGPVVMSPWGTIPYFPLDFQWSGDDILASDTPIPDSDGYFRFRFTHTGGGNWTLAEEGKLPGGPTQSYTLDPVEVEDNMSRWVYLDDPDFLTVLLTVTDDELTLDTRLHGETHAIFQLTR